MADTYTVKKGDTLWAIAKANNTTVNKLVELNDITNPDYIVVGQVIKLSGTATKKTNNTSRAIIKAFGLQSNTDRTIYATWTWTKSYTENYQVQWYYATGDGIWFVGSDTTVTVKQATYNAPSNATKVKFKVKPISKKRKVNNKETSYWTASWSTEKTYSFKDNPPSDPDTPDVKLEKYKLTIEVDGLENANATHVQFQIVKNNKSVYKTVKVAIKTGHAAYSCTVTAGGEYKVRARTVRGSEYSNWTAYSDNYQTAPAAPGGIVALKALSETSIQIDWENVSNADTYTVQYTTKKMYFDSGSSEVKEVSVDAKVAGHAEITGMTSGEEYFIRVRASNEAGDSAWTDIVSIKVGEKPAAPTTWSSTTTAIVGKDVNLYWIHNTVDGSSQTYAILELYFNGSTTPESHTIKNSTNEDEKDKTSVYTLSTTGYSEDMQIKWRVKTCGITGEYGDWSVMRTIDIYEEPGLELTVTDANGESLETLTAFPFYISGLASPNTQAPIGYYLTIVSNSIYETVDSVGNPKIVNAGEAVYSKHFDINDPLLVEMSAGNVDLENNIGYTVRCTVSLDSGLTAENESSFSVAWTDLEYEPNAEIGIDEDNWSAVIRPFCEDENATPIEDISLSIYRREFDGAFTLIAEDITNGNNIFVTDPHPSLDLARYRIVAKTNSTGAISYCDIPGYPVGCYAAVIQWDEEWSTFDTTTEEAMEQPHWAGSMLQLPYNIDVSESNAQDVSLIEYIGRENPVTYYGTQQGYSATWNMVIPYNDKETLYGLRRLQRYMGDVYVREPSGTGYWANVKVSFSQKHTEVTIPVTLSITRVEGGM